MTRIQYATSKVHPTPPEWAKPLPDGVWLTAIAEVRERALWWRALGGIDAVLATRGVDDDAWYMHRPDLSWPDCAIVLAREPIPEPRTVTITLTEDDALHLAMAEPTTDTGSVRRARIACREALAAMGGDQ